MLPLCIVVVIVAINEIPHSADVLTWVALLLDPARLRAGARLGDARRALVAGAAGRRVCSRSRGPTRSRASAQVATILLIVGSCVTLGRLLAGAAPPLLLKLGLIAMAISDAILVFGNTLQAPNAVLVAAEPGAGLPQLQSAALPLRLARLRRLLRRRRCSAGSWRRSGARS